jgi:putative mycofactocin binding protein MftB
VLDRRLVLHPRVALRPEPFGALAYHYGTRRLVFLRHPDLVTVVRALDGATTLAAALTTAGVEERRWPTFARALSDLFDSGILFDPAMPGPDASDEDGVVDGRELTGIAR